MIALFVMTARIVIAGATIVGLIPGCVFSYASDNPNPLLYLIFAPIFPFLGTCPFPIDASNGLGLEDIYFWPILPCLIALALAIFGLVRNSVIVALAFSGVIAVSWALTFIRFFVLVQS